MPAVQRLGDASQVGVPGRVLPAAWAALRAVRRRVDAEPAPALRGPRLPARAVALPPRPVHLRGQPRRVLGMPLPILRCQPCAAPGLDRGHFGIAAGRLGAWLAGRRRGEPCGHVTDHGSDCLHLFGLALLLGDPDAEAMLKLFDGVSSAKEN